MAKKSDESTEAVLPDRHRWAELLTEHREFVKRVPIHIVDWKPQIKIDGVWVRHVSDAPDGVWQFCE